MLANEQLLKSFEMHDTQMRENLERETLSLLVGEASLSNSVGGHVALDVRRLPIGRLIVFRNLLRWLKIARDNPPDWLKRVAGRAIMRERQEAMTEVHGA